MIADVPSGTVGYAVEDLDGNGIFELAIGTISGDDFYGKLIFVLYTLDEGGKPVLIFSSSDRDRYYYAGDNKFANVGSSSAFDSFATTLKLKDEKLTDLAYTTKPTDYVQMILVRF